MASGKTTVARRLGSATNQAVVSLDDLAVRRAGCSVLEYFAEFGQARFRDLEVELLRELDEDRDIILDGGGGLVETPEAVKLIRSRGVVVWLDAPWDCVLGRLQNDVVEDRPLAAGGELSNLEALYLLRLPLYSQTADFRLPVDVGDPDAVVDQVRLRWRMWQDLHTDGKP